jgi:hypothetical protein
MWKCSKDEALCLLIDAQLSKRQYTTIRLQSKAKGADIYPAYNNVRAAKERCYPDPVTATETITRWIQQGCSCLCMGDIIFLPAYTEFFFMDLRLFRQLCCL